MPPATQSSDLLGLVAYPRAVTTPFALEALALALFAAPLTAGGKP